MKTWWINNSWRFWAIRWALAGEPYLAVEIWSEYRYMLNPGDERSLVDLILEEYDRDVQRALSNPIVVVIFWIGRIVSGLR